MNEDTIAVTAVMHETHSWDYEATKEPFYCPDCGAQNVWSFALVDQSTSKYGMVEEWSACASCDRRASVRAYGKLAGPYATCLEELKKKLQDSP